MWEVIAAARHAPEHGEELVRALAERVGVPAEKSGSRSATTRNIRTRSIGSSRWSRQEARELERTLEREQRLLG